MTDKNGLLGLIMAHMQTKELVMNDIHHAEVVDYNFNLYRKGQKDKESPVISIPFKDAATATAAACLFIGELGDLRRALKRELIIL